VELVRHTGATNQIPEAGIRVELQKERIDIEEGHAQRALPEHAFQPIKSRIIAPQSGINNRD